jgi:predicted negative regulator of RcsB-dependent stress response
MKSENRENIYYTIATLETCYEFRELEFIKEAIGKLQAVLDTEQQEY